MGLIYKLKGIQADGGIVLPSMSTASTPVYAQMLAISTGGKLIYSTTAAWAIVSTS